MRAPLLELDFIASGSPKRDALKVGVLVLGVLIVALTVWAEAVTMQRLFVLNKGVGELQSARRSPIPGASSHDPNIERQMKRASLALDDLELPWEGLFAAVEGADSGGLGLVALAPDAPSKVLRISGEANSLEDVFAYIKRLNQQTLLQDVYLMSYSAVERQGGTGVQFTIGAKWKTT